MAELLPPDRVLYDSLPLVIVSADEFVHFAIEISANAQFVVDDDLLQALKASLHLLDPSRSSHELVRGFDVVHDEAIDDADHPGWGNVLREELSVFRH